MSRFRNFEIMDPYYFTETSIFTPTPLTYPSLLLEQEFAFEFFKPKLASIDLFDAVTDLIVPPSFCSYRRFRSDLYLKSLSDRVSEVESKLERLVNKERSKERKYTWAAEIGERKYKLTAEIKGEERKYKWSGEIKALDEKVSKYSFEAVSGDGQGKKEKIKNEKKKKNKGNCGTRIVEIQENENDHGAIHLRQAFAKRAAARTNKGKHKELSPQDAAVLIQMTFKAYLIRRSQALRALRELAIAKAKLKEIRALFNNFSYRRQVSRDAEERQRFSEKIIVLLLTVDAIEGADLMVRAAKKSMVDELEAMLDVVDPQPAGKSLSLKRRTFDVPDGVIRKEIAEGVAQVVKMINNEED